MVSGWGISFELQMTGAKMVSTTVSAGSDPTVRSGDAISRDQIFASIGRLYDWLENNDYKGWDTFDGLDSYARPLALGNKFLQTVLQQGVRRFPINTRPLLGIPKAYSSKGMGFLARGFIRLHQ